MTHLDAVTKASMEAEAEDLARCNAEYQAVFLNEWADVCRKSLIPIIADHLSENARDVMQALGVLGNVPSAGSAGIRRKG